MYFQFTNLTIQQTATKATTSNKKNQPTNNNNNNKPHKHKMIASRLSALLFLLLSVFAVGRVQEQQFDALETNLNFLADEFVDKMTDIQADAPRDERDLQAGADLCETMVNLVETFESLIEGLGAIILERIDIEDYCPAVLLGADCDGESVETSQTLVCDTILGSSFIAEDCNAFCNSAYELLCAECI
mmetsp:Transcript_23243/g.35671  ORF Transcript_23243/g.35671 Transcript_23243/m.35671 type:complete len:188 (+) Transcript_23243:51-614(+)